MLSFRSDCQSDTKNWGRIIHEGILYIEKYGTSRCDRRWSCPRPCSCSEMCPLYHVKVHALGSICHLHNNVACIKTQIILLYNYAHYQFPYYIFFFSTHFHFSAAITVSLLKFCISYIYFKMALRGMDTLCIFSAIFSRGITFVTTCLLSCILSPSLKGSPLTGWKKTEWAPTDKEARMFLA